MVGLQSRGPGALGSLVHVTNKEKVANRSEAREVEKLVGQATWCIGGVVTWTIGPEKAKGALLGSMDRVVAFMSVMEASVCQRTLECSHGLRLLPEEACCPGSLNSNGTVLKSGTF